MTDWPPPKRLPPGFPLPAVDTSGREIRVGAKVRIESVASCAGGSASFSLKPGELAVA